MFIQIIQYHTRCEQFTSCFFPQIGKITSTNLHFGKNVIYELFSLIESIPKKIIGVKQATFC